MIVLASVSLFGVTWLFWYLEKLIKVHGINVSDFNCKTLRVVVQAIAYLNSALNPYLYW